jgi:type III restriction enzyme
MKLQLKRRNYQAASVDAVLDCFQGLPKSSAIEYRIDLGRSKESQQSLPVFDEVSIQ